MENTPDITTIRISKNTLDSLRLKKIELQAEQKRELTYDDVIVILTQGEHNE